VAVQGPAVAAFIDAAIPGGSMGCTLVAQASALRKNQVGAFVFRGASVYVARTGYTGEDGFEVVAAATVLEAIWRALAEAGTPLGLKPAGLGARDNLAHRDGLSLYGHELTETTTAPLEAGLGSSWRWTRANSSGAKCFSGRRPRSHQAVRGVPDDRQVGSPPTALHHLARGPRGDADRRSRQRHPKSILGVGIGMGYVPRRRGATRNVHRDRDSRAAVSRR